MNLIADENVDAGIVAALRDAGYAVTYVRELEPGVDDERVLQLAESKNAPLLTSDKDFGELVFRQRLLHAGVILIRLAGLPVEVKGEVLISVLRAHTAELTGAFTVIGRKSVRIRPGPPDGRSR